MPDLRGATEWLNGEPDWQSLKAHRDITHPCGIDNLHRIAEAYENQWVPAYDLFDGEGKLRGRTAGYAEPSMLENTLKRLLETQ